MGLCRQFSGKKWLDPRDEKGRQYSLSELGGHTHPHLAVSEFLWAPSDLRIPGLGGVWLADDLDSEGIRSEWAVLEAGEAAPGRRWGQQTMTAPFSMQGDQEVLDWGWGTCPPGPGLSPLATPDSPVHKPCRPMAQAHPQNTASHSSGVTCPKRNRMGAIQWLAGRQEQKEVQPETETKCPQCHPCTPHCFSPLGLSLAVEGVHLGTEVSA